MEVRNHFSEIPNYGTKNLEPDIGALQEFGNECDIKTIMERVRKRQVVPINNAEAIFGDFTGVNDFHAAQNKLLEIEESFNTIDPKIRKRFHNDPAQFLDFVMDANNKPEAIELGLIPRPEPVAVDKAQLPS